MSLSLGLLKPDCLKRNLEAEVYRMIVSAGLRIVFKKRTKLDLKKVYGLYGKWKNEKFFSPLCRFMLFGNVEVFVAEGARAIEILESIVGKDRHLNQYSENTIRGRFATSSRENIIHSTRNQQTFVEEARILLDMEDFQQLNYFG